MVILAAYLIVSLNNAASAYSEITKSIAYANRYVKDFKSRLELPLAEMLTAKWKAVSY